MELNNRISVITVCRNSVLNINDCIENVNQQVVSINNGQEVIEHIIIDGDSEDGTKEVIQKKHKEYSHIRWVSEKDSGQSDAMNKGIKMATGNIISFLNVDDRFYPGSLNEVLNFWAQENKPIFLIGQLMTSVNGSIPTIYSGKKADKRIKFFFPYYYRFPFNPVSYFYEKKIHQEIGYYLVDEHYVMDYEFLLRACTRYSFTYTDYVFGEYRLTDNCKSMINTESSSSQIIHYRDYHLSKQNITYRLLVNIIEVVIKIKIKFIK